MLTVQVKDKDGRVLGDEELKDIEIDSEIYYRNMEKITRRLRGDFGGQEISA